MNEITKAQASTFRRIRPDVSKARQILFDLMEQLGMACKHKDNRHCFVCAANRRASKASELADDLMELLDAALLRGPIPEDPK